MLLFNKEKSVNEHVKEINKYKTKSIELKEILDFIIANGSRGLCST